MDTVEGKKGGKVLLTMLFRNSKLMLAFLLADKTRNSVLKVFNSIESILGNDLFQKTFPIILTDNGSEFSNPLSLDLTMMGLEGLEYFSAIQVLLTKRELLKKIMNLFATLYQKALLWITLLNTILT